MSDEKRLKVVSEDKRKGILLVAQNADITINKFGINIDGDKLEDLVRGVIGIKEYGEEVEFRGNVYLKFDEVPRTVNVESDFKIKKEEMVDNEG